MIRYRYRRALLALLLLLALPLAGCKDPYGACAKADADIAQAISSGFVVITQLRASNSISVKEALDVAGYLEFANQADEAFGKCISAAHTAGGKAGAFTGCAQAFNTQLNNPAQLALIHVSDPKASQAVSLVVNGLSAALPGLIAALGGK